VFLAKIPTVGATVGPGGERRLLTSAALFRATFPAMGKLLCAKCRPRPGTPSSLRQSYRTTRTIRGKKVVCWLRQVGRLRSCPTLGCDGGSTLSGGEAIHRKQGCAIALLLPPQRLGRLRRVPPHSPGTPGIADAIPLSLYPSVKVPGCPNTQATTRKPWGVVCWAAWFIGGRGVASLMSCRHAMYPGRGHGKRSWAYPVVSGFDAFSTPPATPPPGWEFFV